MKSFMDGIILFAKLAANDANVAWEQRNPLPEPFFCGVHPKPSPRLKEIRPDPLPRK